MTFCNISAGTPPGKPCDCTGWLDARALTQTSRQLSELREALKYAAEVIHDEWCTSNYHGAPCDRIRQALSEVPATPLNEVRMVPPEVFSDFERFLHKVAEHPQAPTMLRSEAQRLLEEG